LKSVQTYKNINTSEIEKLASHDSFNRKHGLIVCKGFKNVPSIHWLANVHKRPNKSRFIVYSWSCSTKELSIRMALVFQAFKTYIRNHCFNVYENSGVNLFWSIDRSLEVINAINSYRYIVSKINTLDF